MKLFPTFPLDLSVSSARSRLLYNRIDSSRDGEWVVRQIDAPRQRSIHGDPESLAANRRTHGTMDAEIYHFLLYPKKYLHHGRIQFNGSNQFISCTTSIVSRSSYIMQSSGCHYSMMKHANLMTCKKLRCPSTLQLKCPSRPRTHLHILNIVLRLHLLKPIGCAKI